jgi:hypothetical protein
MTTTMIDYVLAPTPVAVQPSPTKIMSLATGEPIMGLFDLDATPFCISTTIGDWMICAGGDGVLSIEHQHERISMEIDTRKLAEWRERIHALAAMLDSDLFPILAAVADAWDAGQILR